MTDDEGSLADFRIAIVGLGLMGGSLAMALKDHVSALYGIDSHAQTVLLANEQAIVDKATDDPQEILPLVDVVILAAPVSVIINYLTVLPETHPGSAIVLDIGSTKVEILKAMQSLPARFDPVGGHPMCGREVSGLANADPRLFHKATFVFSPLERTSERARNFCNLLARTLGAEPLWMDAVLHDRWTAGTSHLPFLLANILASMTPIDAAPLVGPGFRSTARLAASPSRMMIDILATNQQNLLASISGFKQRLELVEALLKDRDMETLEGMLQQGASQYQRLVSKPE